MAVVSVPLVAIPATASASTSAPAASATAAAVQAAEAQGIQAAEARGGTVLLYHPDTGTWTQVWSSTPSQASSAALAEPEATGPAGWACMLVLAICSNFGAEYNAVLTGPAQKITSSLEVLDGRELQDNIIDQKEGTENSQVLKGSDAEKGAKGIATDESESELGIGDGIVDEGSGVSDVFVDIAMVVWLG